MAVRECKKSLIPRRTMREIGFEDAFDGSRCGFRRNVAKQFAAERGIRPKTAADQNVIAFDRVVVFVLLHLAGEQADLRYEMLRAGVMTPGQVNIDGRVERDARFAPARDLLGVTLGVRSGEFAAGIAGAS